MIVDTSALLAFVNVQDSHHEACVAVIDAARDELVVSPYVLAELDYLVATRVGTAAEIAVLEELVGGAWELADFGADDIVRATGIVKRYADQSIGLADASLLVLADRYGTRTVATLDHRHFDVVRPLRGGRFTVLP